MSEQTPTQPAANSIEAFQAAVNSYKQQHEVVSSQVVQLDANYRQQRDQLTKTADMLVGAIAALEQLVKNVNDEAALLAAGTKAPEVVPEVPAAEPVVAEEPSVA